VNKHLHLCHLLVLSSPTLMMHGHTNLKISTLIYFWHIYQWSIQSDIYFSLHINLNSLSQFWLNPPYYQILSISFQELLIQNKDRKVLTPYHTLILYNFFTTLFRYFWNAILPPKPQDGLFTGLESHCVNKMESQGKGISIQNKPTALGS